MKSIRWRLIVWLLVGLILLALVAGYSLYRTARNEAAELFDYELRTVALSLPVTSSEEALTEGPGKADWGSLAEDRLVIQRWEGNNIPQYHNDAALSMPRLTPGFHDKEWDETHWRVYGMQLPDRYVQVAQPIAVRDSLAVGMALRIIAPLWVLVPAIVMFVLWVVSKGLQPISAVSRSVAQRSYESLTPLSFDQPIPSEISSLVNSLNDLLKRLDQAASAQRVFVANAAHELRSPLAALKLQLQHARQQGALGSDSTIAAKLEGRLNRLIHLVQQLLDLARADADQIDIANVIDIRALAEHVVGDYSFTAESRDIDLGLVGPDSPLFVHGDATGLTMLLVNLVDNALRHTPDGGAVDVRLSSQPEGVALEVIDTGHGIAPEELEKVTTRFYRGTDAVGQGSGLGLSIVSRVAERHHARLMLENRPDGAGLTARVAYLLRAEPPGAEGSKTRAV
ncbi:two-component sensor histidine kinase [Pandoraea fibrosis]|uniref:histidine kinase n=1 Tax=Pandoraea fibrosis TaxID=1891094 RepID=A0ABX6HSJ1_9BURK|nr:ATP-binding protein [Pandoraea fibrosis]QHE92562.1 two-component sensor histidine kinase [Pandoraea fibrosis]QHF13882.1 two-component sensor histidine kinase [Pandoraea fibrosis]